MIYLDNNATTQVASEVVELMSPYFNTYYGNPNSLHRIGTELHPAMAKALDQLYAAINARDEDDILITGCATESNNSILMSIYYEFIKTGKKKTIISSQIEHPSVSNTLAFLETLGANVIYLPVDQYGTVNEAILEEALQKNPDTALVSIMWANNETGLIFPIEKLVPIAHQYGALFHTDAVQVIGKVEVDVQKTGVDYLTFSAHKFHGPKGVGGLYLRKNMPFTPLLHGGEQMAGKRAGTINVPLMVGMGLAMELATKNIAATSQRVAKLRDKLEAGIAMLDDIIIIGQDSPRTPNTSLVSFKGIEGEAMLWDLNKNNIAASTGSACSSEDLQPNPTFTAMSFDADLAHTGIRFSLSRYTTEEEIDLTIEAIVKSVTRLREVSLYSIKA